MTTDIRPGHGSCTRCRYCGKPWCPDCSVSGATCDCSPENSPGWEEVSPGQWRRGYKPENH